LNVVVDIWTGNGTRVGFNWELNGNHIIIETRVNGHVLVCRAFTLCFISIRYSRFLFIILKKKNIFK
jgi:hypothetical protein